MTNKQKQTPDNLADVAAVFMRSAAVINDQTSIERTVSCYYFLHNQVQVS